MQFLKTLPVLALLAGVSAVQATPSGLNNIPTGDAPLPFIRFDKTLRAAARPQMLKLNFVVQF